MMSDTPSSPAATSVSQEQPLAKRAKLAMDIDSEPLVVSDAETTLSAADPTDESTNAADALSNRSTPADMADSPIKSDKPVALNELAGSTVGVVAEPLTQDKVFKNMRLRRILRENHGKTLHQVSLFLNAKHQEHLPFGLGLQKTFDRQGAVERDEHDTSNLLATVGGPQASIYDNEHCGDHLDIMSNFHLGAGDADAEPAEFFTCCWVHQDEDALLAVGGSNHLIHILSLAYSKELARLAGHTGCITDLQIHPHNDYHLLSAAKDGTVRLWDLRINQCVCIFQASANVVAYHPSGTSFICGTTRGRIEQWFIPAELYSSAPNATTVDAEIPQVTEGNLLLKYNVGMSESIVCLHLLEKQLVFSNAGGLIVRANYGGEILKEMRIKNNNMNKCRFDLSLDKQYLAVGNAQGVVLVYHLETGKLLAELKHKRSVKAVKSCVFTRDCRSILYGTDDAFLWRYDYIDDATLAEWASKQY
ncbi:hypothetical protein H4R35_003497 [Dimargaris xerosporica]|nr:hypothetical protein H4R35_003497 [Dimargaris xerosporica]